jgi:hypothetical protein
MSNITSTRNRTSETVFAEKEKAIDRELSKLSRPLTSTLATLSAAMRMLGDRDGFDSMRIKTVAYVRPEPVTLSTPQAGHSRRSRLDADLSVRDEIREEVNRYIEAVKRSVHDMWLSADAQCWSPEKCDKILTAMQEDATFHTRDMSSRIEMSKADFANAASYHEIVAHAATLWLDIKAISKHISGHLGGIGRQAWLSEMKR